MKNYLVKIFGGMLLASAALSMAGCGSSGVKETEQTEATVAEIEAAQMAGRKAARRFVSREFKDTMEIQSLLLDISSQRGVYITEGRKAECAAFDSIFISTLRSIRPGLAGEIERMRSQQ